MDAYKQNDCLIMKFIELIVNLLDEPLKFKQ